MTENITFDNQELDLLLAAIKQSFVAASKQSEEVEAYRDLSSDLAEQNAFLRKENTDLKKAIDSIRSALSCLRFDTLRNSLNWDEVPNAKHALEVDTVPPPKRVRKEVGEFLAARKASGLSTTDEPLPVSHDFAGRFAPATETVWPEAHEILYGDLGTDTKEVF